MRHGSLHIDSPCASQAFQVPLVGIWLAGCNSLLHPSVAAACLKFRYNSTLPDKAVQDSGAFLLALLAHGTLGGVKCFEVTVQPGDAPRFAAYDFSCTLIPGQPHPASFFVKLQPQAASGGGSTPQRLPLPAKPGQSSFGLSSSPAPAFRGHPAAPEASVPSPRAMPSPPAAVATGIAPGPAEVAAAVAAALASGRASASPPQPRANQPPPPFEGVAMGGTWSVNASRQASVEGDAFSFKPAPSGPSQPAAAALQQPQTPFLGGKWGAAAPAGAAAPGAARPPMAAAPSFAQYLAASKPPPAAAAADPAPVPSLGGSSVPPPAWPPIQQHGIPHAPPPAAPSSPPRMPQLPPVAGIPSFRTLPAQWQPAAAPAAAAQPPASAPALQQKPAAGGRSTVDVAVGSPVASLATSDVSQAGLQQEVLALRQQVEALQRQLAAVAAAGLVPPPPAMAQATPMHRWTAPPPPRFADAYEWGGPAASQAPRAGSVAPAYSDVSTAMVGAPFTATMPAPPQVAAQQQVPAWQPPQPVPTVPQQQSVAWQPAAALSLAYPAAWQPPAAGAQAPQHHVQMSVSWHSPTGSVQTSAVSSFAAGGDGLPPQASGVFR